MPALLVRDVSKCYPVGAAGGALRRLWPPGNGDHPREVWALRQVSLEVEWGQVVGVVGPVASGKSTLLRVAIGAVPPTSGDVWAEGRVCSVTAVEECLRLDRSGRDNVCLHGARLGLPRQRVAQRMDEVLAFAALQGLADAPVRCYSAGMRQRLAFAIVAHADPQVLLADGLLERCDEATRRQGFRWLREFQAQGGAALLAFHDRAAAARVCDRIVYLEAGVVVREERITPLRAVGPAATVAS